MNTTICGHDRETLKWALRVAEYQGEESAKIVCGTYAKLAFAYPDNADACGKRDALWTIVEPTKLAKVISDTLREFRFCVVENGEDPGDDLFFPAVEVFADGDNVGMHLYKTWNDCQGEPKLTTFTMPQARALELRLLSLPDGATSVDALKALEYSGR